MYALPLSSWSLVYKRKHLKPQPGSLKTKAHFNSCTGGWIPDNTNCLFYWISWGDHRVFSWSPYRRHSLTVIIIFLTTTVKPELRRGPYLNTIVSPILKCRAFWCEKTHLAEKISTVLSRGRSYSFDCNVVLFLLVTWNIST